jgi:hypothetical protein
MEPTPTSPTRKESGGLPFIPAILDDLGLSTHVFRAYGHIARRAGSDGEFFESIPKAARHCKMDEKTFRGAVHFLTKSGMLTRIERRGYTAIYRLAQVRSWKPSQNTPLPNDTIGGNRESSPAKRHLTTPTKSPQTKLPPLKNSQEGTPIYIEQAENIWKQYPKNQGKIQGVKAIVKALKKGFDFDFLIGRVEAYAIAMTGIEPRFIKNAQGWFNGERFNDDPETWTRSTTATRTPIKPDYSKGF